MAPSASARGASPGKTVPGYEILGELGRGGMGVVYQARHLKLDRVVALKMILAGGHAGITELERFRVEAQAIARLQHPNIVQVFEVGEHDGLPFFSLEYCGGGTLKQKLAGTPLPPRGAAALVEILARAMHAAHEKGIIHRDLKPANILIPTTDHTDHTDKGPPRLSSVSSVLSVVKITDFGLAKKLDEAGATATGAVMGTPSYMAPEQAGGKSKELGPACDVYALGAILYECLTGRPPFKAATALDTIMQVVSEEPVLPRQLNAKVPADLETVCLKCLHKEPLKRYRSAEALADDLGRYQRGEPVQARPVGRLERGAKWVRRNPALTMATTAVAVAFVVVAVALLLGAGVSTYFAVAASREAEAEKKAREHAEDLLATSTMMLARSRFEENQPALADELLAQVPGRFRSSGWGLLKRYIGGGRLTTLRGHSGGVRSVAFAADGRVLASGSTDGTVKLWDARTGQELRTLRHPSGVPWVACSSDGHALASSSADGTVKLWDARTGKERYTLRGHTGEVSSIAFAADGQMLASASHDKSVKLWDVQTGRELRTLRGHTLGVASVAFAPDGQVLAAASGDNTVKLHDVRTGQLLRTLAKHSHPVTSVAYAGDGQVLASASADKTVKLWDARTGEELRTLRGHSAIVTSVAFAADGQILASADLDKTVKVWDVRTGQELRTLRGHTAIVTSVAFAADGQVLASASADHTVKLWDVRTGDEPEKERRFRMLATALDVDLQRERAEAADRDKQPFALAFRLGRYLAAKNNPKDDLKPPFSDPTFPDGISCTGVLYKDSNIAPARLLIGTSQALKGDPTNWLNHAFHGGALYRNGEHAKALAALNEAVKLHGKPSPLTQNLLALTYLKLGQADKARNAFAQARSAKDAPWENVYLQRLLQPEVDAAFANAKVNPKEP